MGESIAMNLDVLELLPGLVRIVAPSGVTTRTCRRWRDTTGAAEHEAPEESWRASVHPRDLDELLSTLTTLRQAQRPFEVEYRLRQRRGSYRWVLDSWAPETEDSGRIVRWLSVAVDIHNQRASASWQQHANEFLSTIINTIPTPVFVKDEEHTWMIVNDALCALLGRERGEIIGKSDLDLFSEPEALRLMELDDGVLASGTSAAREVSITQASGVPAYFLVRKSVCTFADGGRLVAGVLLDLSQHKRIEEELVRAREEAVETSRAKSQFLANMSHEIRTPLNGVIGMIALVLDTNLDPLQREYLSTANDSAAALLDLINNVLDLSKIEARRLELEEVPFHLEALLAETLGPFAARALRTGLRFSSQIHPETPEYLVGDPVRVRQVLLNLVGNALKFTREGSVDVSVGPGSGEHEGWLHLRVKDTGIGVPRSQQARIFEVFTQADQSTTRQFGGTGLGLAICRQISELMGGRVWVESEVGRGSTFHLTMKLRAAGSEELAAEPPPDESPIQARSLDVLLTEDNPVNRLVAARCLERLGHRVTPAEHGRRALELLAMRRFDVVLMDVQMPELDGIETARAIREAEARSGRHLPIIALTAHAMRGDKERCLEAGMDAYLTKPLRPPELERMLARVSAGVPLGESSSAGEAGRSTTACRSLDEVGAGAELADQGSPRAA